MSDPDELRREGELDAVYANYLRVGHNAFEYFLDFGQQTHEPERETFHTRIVTSPGHFDAFLEHLFRRPKEETPDRPEPATLASQP